MNTEQFRKHGYQFIDWLADYFTQVENYPVRSVVKPGEIKSLLPEYPPDYGEGMDEIFQDFCKNIFPGITHWQHPGWFAYFPANNSPPSILGELLTAGLGSQCMIWQTSPAAAELEEVVMSWLRGMLGLPEGMDGVIQDTASTATLCALLTARELATGFAINKKGFHEKLRVYKSQEGHSSIDKAVKIAGYGLDNLRSVRVDQNFAMIPDELEKVIVEDKGNGYIPTCAVATIGTTSSTAIDPLEKIGLICKKYGVWLHVDAAFGGAAGLLEEKRHLLQGVELCDSFVFNPHKWMLTNFDCTAYYVKNKEHLIRTFEINPEYLRTGQDALVNNYRDWGIQLGRRFRALKLWFVIRSYGVDGIQSIIREHLRLAQLFKGWVEKDVRFELLAPVPLSLVCFRLIRNNAAEKDLVVLNTALLEKVNETGRVYLTHTTLNDCYAIRLAIGQRTTTEKNVREAWEIICQQAEKI